MREMELWRDKIQLRIRDRIQNSVRAILSIPPHIYPLLLPYIWLVNGYTRHHIFDLSQVLILLSYTYHLLFASSGPSASITRTTLGFASPSSRSTSALSAPGLHNTSSSLFGLDQVCPIPPLILSRSCAGFHLCAISMLLHVHTVFGLNWGAAYGLYASCASWTKRGRHCSNTLYGLHSQRPRSPLCLAHPTITTSVPRTSTRERSRNDVNSQAAPQCPVFPPVSPRALVILCSLHTS